MTTTPTPEALRHRASARRWALAGEGAFTVASAAVNVTVVAAAGGSLLRILLAGLAPVVLAAMSRLLAKLLQAELTVSGIPAKVHRAVAFAVAVIAAGAFYLSFETLRRAAEPDHGDMAWVFPATLDLAIVVCAAVLAVIARADEADQRAAATQPLDDVVERAKVKHQPSAPAPELATKAVQPVYPAGAARLTKPVHTEPSASVEPERTTPAEPVHQPDGTAPEAVRQPSAPAVTSGDDPVQTAEQAVHQDAETEPVHLVQTPERPRLVSVHRDGAPGSLHRSKPTAKVQPRTTSAPEQSADDAPPVQPVHVEQAEAVGQGGGIDLSVETIAAVFARKDAGQSQNEIANAKVANKRTVSKLLARREELSAAEAEDPDRATAGTASA